MEHNIAQGAPIGSPVNHRSSSAVPSLEKALIKRDDADLLRAVGRYHIHGPLTFQPSTKRIKMSHFTEIKTQIKDIEALRSACAELGLTLLQNADARGNYENKTKGNFVVQLKGPYDIASTRMQMERMA
jgi:hypothetical protein